MSRRYYKKPEFILNGKAILLSDPHFFHHNIIKYDGRTQFLTPSDIPIYEEFSRTGARGPRISDESVIAMNEFILDAINSEVEDPEKDTVIIAGDFAFGNSPNQYRRNAQYCRDRINCWDVRLVFGNHDEPDEIHDLFSYCYDHVQLLIDKQPCFVSHYPHWCHSGPDHTWMLHGHVHGLYENTSHPHPFSRPNLWLGKDIGVNTNGYRPYTIEQIRDYMKPIIAARAEAKRELLF